MGNLEKSSNKMGNLKKGNLQNLQNLDSSNKIFLHKLFECEYFVDTCGNIWKHVIMSDFQICEII